MGLIEFTPGDGTFNTMPEGAYDFEIIEAKQGVSSGGHPQVELLTQIIGGPEDGRKARMWYVITDKSGWKIDKLLAAIGLESVDAGNGKKGFDPDMMVNAVFQADATLAKTPDGRDKNEFKNERPSPLAAQAQAPTPAPTPQPAVAPAAAPAAAPGTGFAGAARSRRAGA